jgi:hypothetical protein
MENKASEIRLQTFSSDVSTVISPASFWMPEYICPSSAWIQHAPFAFWISGALRPRCFVELGTQYGYSYFAFCQAIDRLALGTVAYAIDTWKGDEHAGFYDEHVFQSVAARNNEKYAAFSSLLRSTFVNALDYFADGSVDLLHIDGRHFYNDVKHDFTMWRSKLTEGGVVLFHDTNVREREFGVWKFFAEIAKGRPSFQFFHGHGLGVVALGDRGPERLASLFEASSQTANQIRAVYSALGGALMPRRALAAKAEAISLLLNKKPGPVAADSGILARIGEGDDQIGQLHSALETRDCAIGELRAQIEQHRADEAALRAQIEQHEATEAALRAELDQTESTEATLRAEIEHRAETEAALRAELDQTESTEATLRAEIEHRAETEAMLRAQIEQGVVTQAQLQAEVERGMKTEAALRNALDQVERKAEDRKATIQVTETELVTIRHTLAETDRRLQERAMTAEAFVTEVDVLRTQLREAEAQISLLRSELAAAREVGRAALESLR